MGAKIMILSKYIPLSSPACKPKTSCQKTLCKLFRMCWDLHTAALYANTRVGIYSHYHYHILTLLNPNRKTTFFFLNSLKHF